MRVLLALLLLLSAWPAVASPPIVGPASQADLATETSRAQAAEALAVRTVNGHAGSSVTVTLGDLGAAPLFSPSFTGIPTAPTAVAGTSSQQLASTAFVRNAIGNYATALAPVSGSTVTTPVGAIGIAILPTAALAALTVPLPASPQSGDPFCIFSTQAVATLTLSGPVPSAPLYLNANWAECFRFDGTNWDWTTNASLPSPSVMASIILAATQMNADVQGENAILQTMMQQAAAIDQTVASVDSIVQATPTQLGTTYAAQPGLPCVGSDPTSGLPDVACSATAFEPYPANNLALTATGTNQAGCLQLVAGYNAINGGGGGGVCLPAASGALPTTILSLVNQAITVYPNGTDTINGGASGAGVTLPAGWGEKFRPTTMTAWQPDNDYVPSNAFATLASPAFTGSVSFAGATTFNGNLLVNQVIRHNGMTHIVVTNGGTATVPPNTDTEELEPPAPIAGFTLTMPLAPVDGQDVIVPCGQTITTLTLAANTGQFMRPATSGSGTTISGTCGPTFNGGARVRWNSSQTAWIPW